jgi:hypothetical protein
MTGTSAVMGPRGVGVEGQGPGLLRSMQSTTPTPAASKLKAADPASVATASVPGEHPVDAFSPASPTNAGLLVFRDAHR